MWLTWIFKFNAFYNSEPKPPLREVFLLSLMIKVIWQNNPFYTKNLPNFSEDVLNTSLEI